MLKIQLLEQIYLFITLVLLGFQSLKVITDLDFFVLSDNFFLGEFALFKLFFLFGRTDSYLFFWVAALVSLICGVA